jgi:hypothetical protein
VLYSHLAFLLLYNSLTFCLCFWLMTVKTRAIDFRTPLLQEEEQDSHSQLGRYRASRWGLGRSGR